MPFHGRDCAWPSPYPFQYEYPTQGARLLLSAGFGAEPRACSSVWLERTPDKREVGSSSLPRPTIILVLES